MRGAWPTGGGPVGPFLRSIPEAIEGAEVAAQQQLPAATPIQEEPFAAAAEPPSHSPVGAVVEALPSAFGPEPAGESPPVRSDIVSPLGRLAAAGGAGGATARVVTGVRKVAVVPGGADASASTAHTLGSVIPVSSPVDFGGLSAADPFPASTLRQGSTPPEVVREPVARLEPVVVGAPTAASELPGASSVVRRRGLGRPLDGVGVAGVAGQATTGQTLMPPAAQPVSFATMFGSAADTADTAVDHLGSEAEVTAAVVTAARRGALADHAAAPVGPAVQTVAPLLAPAAHTAAPVLGPAARTVAPLLGLAGRTAESMVGPAARTVAPLLGSAGRTAESLVGPAARSAVPPLGPAVAEAVGVFGTAAQSAAPGSATSFGVGGPVVSPGPAPDAGRMAALVGSPAAAAERAAAGRTAPYGAAAERFGVVPEAASARSPTFAFSAPPFARPERGLPLPEIDSPRTLLLNAMQPNTTQPNTTQPSVPLPGMSSPGIPLPFPATASAATTASGTTAAATTAAATTNSAAPAVASASSQDLDDLARRLYEPLSARIRAELWLDRERSGRLTDM